MVTVIKFIRETLDVIYIPLDDETVIGLGTPLCDPYEISLTGATTTSDTQAEISIIKLDAQNDQEKFSVCFKLSSEFLNPIEIRLFNEETYYWDFEGEVDD